MRCRLHGERFSVLVTVLQPTPRFPGTGEVPGWAWAVVCRVLCPSPGDRRDRGAGGPLPQPGGLLAQCSLLGTSPPTLGACVGAFSVQGLTFHLVSEEWTHQLGSLLDSSRSWLIQFEGMAENVGPWGGQRCFQKQPAPNLAETWPTSIRLSPLTPTNTKVLC